MKVLLCHNYYKLAGGEDRCYVDEGRLLERHGHQVFRYEQDNKEIRGAGQVTAAVRAVWNQRTYREIQQLIREHRIDLVHCTNLFPLISPSLYYAARRQRVPVIQSLHNYRLFCANSYFLRDAKVCEDCAGRMFAWPAVRHACYRDSRAGSAVVAGMQSIHHRIGSWRKRVTRFIALTDFARDKFVSLGLPADRICIKPNFVDPIPEPGRGDGNYALFVGRLSPEKGIDVLIRAWDDPACTLPLRILGDGPLRGQVESAANQNPRIQYVGSRSPAEVLAIMASARFLVVPSIWYEGLPRTIVESLAVGTPVVAADIGSLTDLARPESGGSLFPPGDHRALSRIAGRLCRDEPLAMRMRAAARAEFMNRYSAATNYQILMSIYDLALGEQY